MAALAAGVVGTNQDRRDQSCPGRIAADAGVCGLCRLWRRLHARVVALLWLANGMAPDLWDLAGASLALVGPAIILFAPRG